MIELHSPLLSEKEIWLRLWHDYSRLAVDDIIGMTWERIHDPKEPIYAIAAYEDGVMVGFTTYLFHRTTWARADYCYLEDLYVEERLRGKGVGKMLVDGVRAAAKAVNADRLYLHTQQKNTIAQALYDKVGTLSDFIQYRIPI